MWRDRQPGPAGGPVVSASILGGQQGTSVKKPVARQAANRRRWDSRKQVASHCADGACCEIACPQPSAAMRGHSPHCLGTPLSRLCAVRLRCRNPGVIPPRPRVHLEPFVSAQVHAPLTFVALVWRLNVVQQACPVGWTRRPEAPERVTVLQCARSFRLIREIRW